MIAFRIEFTNIFISVKLSRSVYTFRILQYTAQYVTDQGHTASDKTNATVAKQGVFNSLS